jgi:hypothetical protein
MAEFVLSFVFLLIIVVAMAIGVIRGRAPISGSCGGLNRVGLGGPCEICGGDTNKCEEEGPFSDSPNNTTYYKAS